MFEQLNSNCDEELDDEPPTPMERHPAFIPMEKQAALTFVKFNHGIEKGKIKMHRLAEQLLISNITDSTAATQPCEPGFLEALIRDMLVLTYLASRELPKMTMLNMDETLPRDATILATNLREVMQQCRRLKATPELFPSAAIRDEFLKMLSKVSPRMATISAIVTKVHEARRYDPVKDTLPADSEEKWMPHPNMANGKPPWNSWLENSGEAPPTWVAIQQKIPRYGEVLMKKLTLEYNALEAHFVEVCFAKLSARV
jgi:hypothetical protein